MSPSAQKIEGLKNKANLIRQDIIKMLHEAGSGHSAGSLGMADVLTALYFHVLNHNPRNPLWPDRDRLVLSHGHVCPALYAALSLAGYFPAAELKTLRKINSRLQGHPHRESLPGIETTSGPLGSGLSQAAGMALAGKIEGERWRVYCLMSDAEQEEGNVWEAVMLAGKNKLSNLTALIDCNGIQIDGLTRDVMPSLSLRKKYEAFGWEVLEIDGHKMEEIIKAFGQTGNILDKPAVILAKTTPGKGVSFMENKPEWHGKVPNREETEKALKELGGK